MKLSTVIISWTAISTRMARTYHLPASVAGYSAYPKHMKYYNHNRGSAKLYCIKYQIQWFRHFLTMLKPLDRPYNIRSLKLKIYRNSQGYGCLLMIVLSSFFVILAFWLNWRWISTFLMLFTKSWSWVLSSVAVQGQIASFSIFSRVIPENGCCFIFF